MPSVLTSLRISSIGVVDKGASGNASLRPEIVLFKRASAKPTTESLMSVAKYFAKLLGRKPVEKADPESPEAMLEAALKPLDEDSRAAIMAAVTRMLGDMKSMKAEPPPAEETGDKDKEPPVAKSAEVVTLEKRAADAEAKAAELAKKQAEGAERIAKLEKTVADERIAKRKGEVETVAKSFPHVPGDMTKRIDRLMKLRDADETAYTEAVAELKAADELIGKGLAVNGAGTTRAGVEGSAEAEIEQLAKGLVAKSSGKGRLTYEQAYAKACEENPDTYRRLVAEQRERRPAAH